MITSALIAQCRREYGDEPKSVSVSRNGNGSITLFNTGKFPIVENSYKVYLSGALQTENAPSGYSINLDNGDIQEGITPGNGKEVKAEFKFAFWRDQNWNEAINQSIQTLNGMGFFRQVVQSSAAIKLSAGIVLYSAPSGCVDLYEFLVSDNFTTSGNFKKPYVNWRYDQDGNKLVLGIKPSVSNYAKASYLRNMNTFTSTSATIDVLGDWIELVKKNAGAIFYRSMAGKIAKQGNATVDEGHFSFTNLRTMANDLDTSFQNFAKRKKPARPAKDLSFKIENQPQP